MLFAAVTGSVCVCVQVDRACPTYVPIYRQMFNLAKKGETGEKSVFPAGESSRAEPSY